MHPIWEFVVIAATTAVCVLIAIVLDRRWNRKR